MLDLSSLGGGDGFEPNTDNQKIDVLNLNGTDLEISLEGDSEATKVLDLSSLGGGGSVEASIAFPFNSGYQNMSAFEDATYYKHNERVYIDGVFGRSSGTFQTGNIIGTLPVGYRPSETKNFAMTGFTGGGHRIIIESDGDVIYQGAHNFTTNSINLYISFRI